jgi:2-polyprenyl-3-methyl-5-hydroxy-6-metoxy-1,4-benzoquinol methylase
LGHATLRLFAPLLAELKSAKSHEANMSDTTYSYKEENYFEQQRREMLPYIPLNAKRVLEVGCGNGSFAAHLKSQRSVQVVAIEAHPAAAEKARRRVDRLIQATIEEALPKLAGEQFDCVVFNDVLEHLVDPWAALSQTKPLLSEHGRVVASIPNVRYFPVLKDLVLKGHWEYQQQGVLDRTHLRFFTAHSMRQLFTHTGFDIQTLEGINGIPFPWKLGVLNALSGQALKDTRFPQFACVATVSKERPDERARRAPHTP